MCSCTTVCVSHAPTGNDQGETAKILGDYPAPQPPWSDQGKPWQLKVHHFGIVVVLSMSFKPCCVFGHKISHSNFNVDLPPWTSQRCNPSENDRNQTKLWGQVTNSNCSHQFDFSMCRSHGMTAILIMTSLSLFLCDSSPFWGYVPGLSIAYNICCEKHTWSHPELNSSWKLTNFRDVVGLSIVFKICFWSQGLIDCWSKELLR